MRGRIPTMEELHEVTIVHYDIRSTHAVSRTELQRFLSGRIVMGRTKGGPKKYRYPGLLWEGGERVGQSVLLLDSDLADRLLAKLQELRIRYWTRTVYVE